MKYMKLFENFKNTSNIKNYRNGYHSLTIDEMNNSASKGGDILYHGIRVGGKEALDDILINGFKFSGNEKSLTPYSASFFDDKHDAARFSSDDNIVCYKLPLDMNLLDMRIEENQNEWYKFLLKKYSSERPESLSNLKEFGGYDGLITELTGQGIEYRIYNEEKLNNGIFFTFNKNNPYMMSKELQNTKGFSKEISDRIIHKSLYDYINLKYDTYEDSLKNSIGFYK